jgi:hypothetical protein
MLPKMFNKDGILYIPFRKLTFKKEDKDVIEGLKELWMCDTVLKDNNDFYFCRKVDDIEFEPINK